MRVGLLIVTRVSASKDIAAPGRVSSSCFCTLPTHANPTLSLRRQAARHTASHWDHCTLAAPPSLPLLPSPVLARSLAPSDVPHLIFLHLCRHPTQRAPAAHASPPPATTTLHTPCVRCRASWGYQPTREPYRELSPQRSRPPCPCPLRSSTPQCAPSTRAAATQYVTEQLATARKVGWKLTTPFLQQKQAQATLNQVGEALLCDTE